MVPSNVFVLHSHMVNKVSNHICFRNNKCYYIGPLVGEHTICIIICYPHTGLTVDSSQLTFLPTSKSRDTKTKPNIKKSDPIKFRYCAPV